MMYDDMTKSHPKLDNGMVWCKTCGRSQKVDSAVCLRSGWPKCCGYTMTIDPPEEWNNPHPTGDQEGRQMENDELKFFVPQPKWSVIPWPGCNVQWSFPARPCLWNRIWYYLIFGWKFKRFKGDQNDNEGQA